MPKNVAHTAYLYWLVWYSDTFQEKKEKLYFPLLLPFNSENVNKSFSILWRFIFP